MPDQNPALWTRLRHENIRRLQVTVRDAFAVSRLQPSGDTKHEVCDLQPARRDKRQLLPDQRELDRQRRDQSKAQR